MLPLFVVIVRSQDNWLRAQPYVNGHHSNPCFSVNVWTAGIVVTIDNEPIISTSISPRVQIPHSANNKIGYTTNYNTLHVRYTTKYAWYTTKYAWYTIKHDTTKHDTLQSTIHCNEVDKYTLKWWCTILGKCDDQWHAVTYHHRANFLRHWVCTLTWDSDEYVGLHMCKHMHSKLRNTLKSLFSWNIYSQFLSLVTDLYIHHML